MDVSNDNDDNNMDIDNHSLNENNRSHNELEDNIDHGRLRELANYADQNRDYPTRIYSLSALPELDREEMRVGETKMVSYQEPDRYEGTGISLDWGEYYVPDGESGSNSGGSDDSLSSCEEAEEINEEEVDREIEQVAALTNNIIQNRINFEQLNNFVDASNPTFMGMPDTILEKIIHFATEQPSEVCVLERVCKRINKMTTNDEFWARHPSSKCWSEFHITAYHQKGIYTADLPLTRKGAFMMEAFRNIRKYQKSTSNAILDVLGDEEECIADTFRTISADILSRMTHFGPEAHFRLRGDTIGYIVEILQGYMVDRLEAAILLAIHRQSSNHEGDTWAIERRVVQVQGDDIALAFRRQTASCYSSSGIVWRWPLDNCHDVLPAEAGRRIIRRLAYNAGIPEMSNDAFILAEAELLHVVGLLLVSSYDSCVNTEQTRATQLLSAEEQLTYNEPNASISMFKTPPPPFYSKPRNDYYQDHPDDAVVYTIVPGQIETAAEQRGLTPTKVLGDVWVAISGFSPKEEKKTEKSYYYKETFHNDDSEESDSDSVGSDSFRSISFQNGSVWVDNDWDREYDEDEDSNIDYEMDMHYYYDSKEDMDLYYDSEMEIDLNYDSRTDEMYSHEPKLY